MILYRKVVLKVVLNRIGNLPDTYRIPDILPEIRISGTALVQSVFKGKEATRIGSGFVRYFGYSECG
jgi:hypothetical protein